MRQILAAALLLGAVSSPAFAQMPDQEFVNKAAVGGMFEIQSSRAVLDGGANSAEIERFAQDTRYDRTKSTQPNCEQSDQRGSDLSQWHGVPGNPSHHNDGGHKHDRCEKATGG